MRDGNRSWLLWRLPAGNEPETRYCMLWTIAVILLILWLLGGFAFRIGGGLIHILLVIAIIVIAVDLLHR